jgi:hypothetical protein
MPARPDTAASTSEASDASDQHPAESSSGVVDPLAIAATLADTPPGSVTPDRRQDAIAASLELGTTTDTDAHELARQLQIAARALQPGVAEQAASSSQPPNVQPWNALLAAQSLGIDDGESVAGVTHEHDAAWPGSFTPLRYRAAQDAFGSSIAVRIEAPTQPLPMSPGAPLTLIPGISGISPPPSPGPTSGSVSTSTNGPPGAAAPLLAGLALLQAWRSLWRSAALRPDGIVLPSLAPPG